MQTNATDRVGGTVPATLAGKSYMLAPLTVEAMLSLQAAGVEAAYSDARKRVRFLEEVGVATPEAKKEVTDALFRELDTGRAEARFVKSFEGGTLAVWWSLREHHPEVTLDDVRKMLKFTDLADVQATVDRVSFPEAVTVERPVPPQETPPDPLTPGTGTNPGPGEGGSSGSGTTSSASSATSTAAG